MFDSNMKLTRKYEAVILTIDSGTWCIVRSRQALDVALCWILSGNWRKLLENLKKLCLQPRMYIKTNFYKNNQQLPLTTVILVLLNLQTTLLVQFSSTKLSRETIRKKRLTTQSIEPEITFLGISDRTKRDRLLYKIIFSTELNRAHQSTVIHTWNTAEFSRSENQKLVHKKVQ